MTRKITGTFIPETKFQFPFRIILSGSSGSGKTHFAEQLLKKRDLFEECTKYIVYYYPCYLSQAPVSWEESVSIPISYRIGLPTKEELMQLPSNSCVVIDDSYDEAIKSSAIDHLFRVISGKRKISVVIMTQNNFTKGKYGREIRNSCNFAVLFRNCCDTSINETVCRMAGLSKAYLAASNDTENLQYPYYFIDQSQRGQLSSFRLFTNIFSRFKISWSTVGMKGYIINASDFESYFTIISTKNKFEATQNRHEDKNAKISSGDSPSEKTYSEKPQNSAINWSDSSESDEENGSSTESEGHDEYEREIERIKPPTVCREKPRNEQSENPRPKKKVFRTKFSEGHTTDKKRPRIESK